MISILHLSDLHIFKKSANWHNMRARILKEAAGVRNRPDGEKLLIITGDFHNFLEADYANAEEFVRGLIDTMGIDVKEDVFVVPGNHDVGSPAAMESFFSEDSKWGYRQRTSVKNLKELEPSDEDYDEAITQRLESYIPYKDFVTRLGIYEKDKEPAAVHVRCWRDKLNILHLNTTLVADGKEKHNQKVDKSLAADDSIWAQFASDLPAIALGHNHFYDLKKDHQNILLGTFGRHNVRAYLCGDTHKENIDPNEQHIHLVGQFHAHPSIPNVVCVKGAADDSDKFSDFGLYWHEWNEKTDAVTLKLLKWEESDPLALKNVMINESAYSLPRECPNTALKGMSAKENISPDDSILRINKEYVTQCLIKNNEDAEETKEMFYGFRHPCDITFKMLINKLAIRGDEYERICQTILDLACSTTLTFLTNDRGGGIGKSVTLCAVALLAFEKRLDVFYLKGIPSSLPELSGESLFLIDDALDFQETIQRMHKKYKKSSRIHIIMADRVVKTRTLYDELESAVTDWLLTAKAVVLNRQTETFEMGFLKKDSVIRIDVSDELICSISNQLIANRIAAQSLTPDISIPLNYKNKNIMDVVFDYFLSYNKVAETQANMGKYEWDWDEWGKIPELKGLFKYVAALYSCGVHVSTTCLERIQRGSMEALHSANLLAIRVENNFIKLRHDTVADHFFAITKIPPSDILIQLLENDWLDEETVVRFEKSVFSLRNIKASPLELKTYNIPKLLDKFAQNTNYRQILRQKQRIHSLDLAIIMQKNNNGEYDDKDAISQAIGASFDDVENVYRNKIMLWIKYFNFTARSQTVLPSEMLKTKYLEKDGLYKKITSIISESYLQPKRLWYEADEIGYILSNSERVFKSIIGNIDATDKPSIFALSDIYLKQNKFIDAVNMIQEIETLPNLDEDTKYYCATKTLKIYKKEKKHLRKRYEDQFNNRIRILDGIMGRMYTEWITYYEENNYYSKRYAGLIAGYADFLRTKGNFDTACMLLHNTIECFEKQGADALLHSVYNAMGQLYQDPRYNGKNLNIAGQYFRKGKDCASKNKKSIMSSLKPLCKTMLESGNYEECKKLCKELHMVDSNDPEVFLLMLEAYRLEKVQEQQLPIGNEFDLRHKQWLEESSETEIADAVERILKTMTDMQRMFADEFGCNEKYRESGFLKDSYVMIHCIFNNRAIPINLQTEWIIDRSKRHSLRKKYFETHIIKAAVDLAPSDSDD